MKAVKKAGRGRRIDFLDSVRGLASLIVAWSHYVQGYEIPASEPLRWWLLYSPLRIWWDGSASVSMFFVLSGFVLALRFLERPLRFSWLLASWPAFLVQRVVRIWGPFILVFLVSLGLRYSLPTRPATSPSPIPWLGGMWTEAWDTKTILGEAVLLFPPLPTYLVVTQSWTLAYELMISAFIPWMAFLCADYAMVLLIGTAALSYADLVPVYAVHFALGVFLARTYQRRSLANRRLRPVSIALVLVLALFLYTFRFALPLYMPGSENLVNRLPALWWVTGVGSFLLLALLLVVRSAQAFLARPGLVYLGRISYSLYLTHFWLLLCVAPWLLAWLNGQGIEGHLAWWLGFVVFTVACLGLAAVFHRLVEQPLVRLAGSLARRLDSKKRPGLTHGKRSLKLS